MLVIKTSERKAKIKSMPLGENEQILLKPRGIFATRAGDVATGEFYSENIVTKYHKTVEERKKGIIENLEITTCYSGGKHNCITRRGLTLLCFVVGTYNCETFVSDGSYSEPF